MIRRVYDCEKVRFISPDIFQSKLFYAFGSAGEIGMIGGLLWFDMIGVIADDQGRMEDSPVGILLGHHRAQSLMFGGPFAVAESVTPQIIEKSLRIMARNGSILRYRTRSGERLIQLVNWWRYQNKAQHMGPSRYPPPPKWRDRCNYAGPGRRMIRVNWDREGGFSTKRITRPTKLYTRDDVVRD